MTAPSGRRKRHTARIATAAAIAVVAAVAIVAGLSSTSAPPRTDRPAKLADCAAATSRPAMRRCYVDAMLREVRGARDPTPVLARIDVEVNRIGEFPASNCHTLMHAVGRRYAHIHRVRLATLMDYLPRSNDAGCAAGFAHGIITAIAPEVLRAGPAAAEAVCGRAATRFERYSCTHGLGHAYMRYYAASLTPSLRLCRGLGPGGAPDCAQGVFHDYWLAIVGADETKRPTDATTDVRRLCATQPRAFVQPCWYRAFIETRPVGYQTRSAADIERICAGLTNLQREGCVTAASVIGSSNPLTQMRVCARLSGDDALACVRGVKVQNLVGTPSRNQLAVIGRCAWLRGRVATGCYEWLGKVLEVISDGDFSRSGCPQVAEEQACLRGARSSDGALVTFS